MKGSCSAPNASVWSSNTQGSFWLILLFASVTTVSFKKRNKADCSKLPLPLYTISIGTEHMEVRKCSVGLARLALVIPLMRHATLTFCYWLREVNRSVFSSTPSLTQRCLQNRVSLTWLFLVDCCNYGITDVQPWLSLARCITVLPLRVAFLICCDLQTLLAHMSWLSHLWLSASHRQTRIDGTGSTPVILSADGPKPSTSLSLSAAFWKSGQNWKLTF